VDVRELLATSRHALLVVDRTGVAHYANAAAAELLDLRPEQMVGRALLDDVHPLHRRAARTMLESVDDSTRQEVELRLAGEPERWILLRGVPVPGGELVQLAVTDVTDRRRDARRLRLSEQRFRAAFTASAVAMALLDARGRFVHANEAFAALVGRPVSWFAGRTSDGITVAQDRPLARRVAAEIRAWGAVRSPSATCTWTGAWCTPSSPASRCPPRTATS